MTMKGEARSHDLKSWPEWFEAVTAGGSNASKRFEVRLNDRDFHTGDLLHLREWNPETEEYTGREAWFTVTYLLNDGGDVLVPRGIMPGYVVMSIRRNW